MKSRYKLIKDFPTCNLNVGDTVELDTLGQYVSENLEIFERHDVECYPENWVKIENPILFVSTDGHKMYHGDVYYVPQIDGHNTYKGNCCSFIASNLKNNDNSNVRFYCENSAKDYIDLRLKKYSIKDIELIYKIVKSDVLYFKTLTKYLKKNEKNT